MSCVTKLHNTTLQFICFFSNRGMMNSGAHTWKAWTKICGKFYVTLNKKRALLNKQSWIRHSGHAAVSNCSSHRL